MPLVPFGVPQAAGFNLTVAKVQVPLPDFSVATVQVRYTLFTTIFLPMRL